MKKITTMLQNESDGLSETELKNTLVIIAYLTDKTRRLLDQIEKSNLAKKLPEF